MWLEVLTFKLYIFVWLRCLLLMLAADADVASAASKIQKVLELHETARTQRKVRQAFFQGFWRLQYVHVLVFLLLIIFFFRACSKVQQSKRLLFRVLCWLWIFWQFRDVRGRWNVGYGKVRFLRFSSLYNNFVKMGKKSSCVPSNGWWAFVIWCTTHYGHRQYEVSRSRPIVGLATPLDRSQGSSFWTRGRTEFN